LPLANSVRGEKTAVLKRLELVGFKSFADKTQFDFAPGVTAIVGPNGSGKSNVVDAVRWILGEQSAKSLRGGEMADVIFNGSATRKSLGLAEVTLTFDNARRQLAIDAEEVQITRRVYRSGEGEYLINQQLSRLKDIKDLFLGTGAGSHAYCIIEQGRVDSMLQASTKERRIIFEEAAGISRFKSRKLETLRKLERVDQNLQQLKLILDEVDKQLRSVKLQASKAQRHQEYSQRLRELRVALSLHDYHQLSQQLGAASSVLEGLRGELAERSAQTQSWEVEVRRLDESLLQLDETLHEQEGRHAQAKQQIATADTTLGRERELSAEQEKELAARRTQLADLNVRTAALAEAATEAARACAGVEGECQHHHLHVQTMAESHQGTIVRLNVLQRQVQADNTEHFQQMQKLARCQNDVTSRKGQLESLRRERDRLRHKGDQAAEHLAVIDIELQALTGAEEALQTRLAAARHSLAEKSQERERFRQRGEATAALLTNLKTEHSGIASRIDVLDRLERSHEGLGAGAREVFALLEQPDPGPWRTVLGIVADFLTVPREHAALIDLALGETAQRFLVRDLDRLYEALRQQGQPFSGRVSFLPIEPRQHLPAPAPGLLEAGKPAVSLVTCDHPELAHLPAQLLGDTLVVPDLDTAKRLTGEAPGLRLLTAQGELLEADGTLTVGAHHAGTGILSRKSELRELRQVAEALQRRIVSTESDLTGIRRHESALEAQAVAVQEEINVLSDQAADLRSRIGQHRQQREGLHEEVQLSRSEISGLEQDIATLEVTCQQAVAQVDEAERQLLVVQQRKEQAEREIREKEVLREQQAQERETAKVALAQVEERLKGLRARRDQTEQDLVQRRQEREQGASQLQTSRARWEESQRTMLQAQADLARWYLEKEAAQRLAAQLTLKRDEQRRQRHAINEQLQGAHNSWRTQQEQASSRELEASNLRNRRDHLAARLREDYQLELADLYGEKVAGGQWPVSSTEYPVPSTSTESKQETEEAGAAGTEGPAAAEQVASEDASEQTADSCEPATSTAAIPEGSLPTTAGLVTLAQANEEIEELKRKVQRLGSVNLEALQELVELETRAKDLKTQYDDLTASQKSLLDIIGQINQDSKRLFGETFTTIRGHFQELFRKLFGGGRADVVLEDENDILDCGIEIIAQPPGKELRSISLMSGGEKTMTAVALLLSIFRSKPSPFCILDEVDAALDEANIGRFSAVLRDFLDLSQFILITHSKKTMATADVLYGVTMQESGISKRVAVRFGDWEKRNGTSPSESQPSQTAQDQGFAGR
jgi:chromosome segregation protein